METLTDEQIEQWKRTIDTMAHRDMARLWRFAPSGHPIFRNDLPLFEYFKARFQKLGGMTPAISKEIGW